MAAKTLKEQRDLKLKANRLAKNSAAKENINKFIERVNKVREHGKYLSDFNSKVDRRGFEKFHYTQMNCVFWAVLCLASFYDIYYLFLANGTVVFTEPGFEKIWELYFVSGGIMAAYFFFTATFAFMQFALLIVSGFCYFLFRMSIFGSPLNCYFVIFIFGGTIVTLIARFIERATKSKDIKWYKTGAATYKKMESLLDEISEICLELPKEYEEVKPYLTEKEKVNVDWYSFSYTYDKYGRADYLEDRTKPHVIGEYQVGFEE